MRYFAVIFGPRLQNLACILQFQHLSIQSIDISKCSAAASGAASSHVTVAAILDDRSQNLGVTLTVHLKCSIALPDLWLPGWVHRSQVLPERLRSEGPWCEGLSCLHELKADYWLNIRASSVSFLILWVDCTSAALISILFL